MDKTAEIDEPAGTFSRAVLNRLPIDMSWASRHPEGTTYSRLDTRELIEVSKIARGKAVIETQMILNHKAAIELLVENINSAELNRYTLMKQHSALADKLLPNPADENRIRHHAMNIGKSANRLPSTPQQIEDALDTLLDMANLITDPFEQSFFVMVHLPNPAAVFRHQRTHAQAGRESAATLRQFVSADVSGRPLAGLLPRNARRVRKVTSKTVARPLRLGL